MFINSYLRQKDFADCDATYIFERHEYDNLDDAIEGVETFDTSDFPYMITVEIKDGKIARKLRISEGMLAEREHENAAWSDHIAWERSGSHYV